MTGLRKKYKIISEMMTSKWLMGTAFMTNANAFFTIYLNKHIKKCLHMLLHAEAKAFASNSHSTYEACLSGVQLYPKSSFEGL